MGVTTATLYKWETRIKPVRGKDDIKGVTKALKVLLTTTAGNETWLEQADKVATALNGIKDKRKGQYAAAIAELRTELVTDIAIVQAQVDSAVATRTMVKVDDWLDINLPEVLGQKDVYRVQGETPELRKLRRLVLKKTDLGFKPQVTLLEAKQALLKPLTNHGDVWYWTPGKMCHYYSENASAIFGSGKEVKGTIDVRSTLQGQKDAYIAVVFRRLKAKETDDHIVHTYCVKDNPTGALDVTYLQFFDKGHGGLNWRLLPPVFSGTEAEFERLFPMCRPFGSSKDKDVEKWT